MSFFEVEEVDFDNLVSKELDKGNFVVVKFGSELCDACQALDFELEELDDNNDDISILNIDINEAPNLSDRYGIDEIPSMIIYNSKKEILYSYKGVILAQDIQSIIKP